MSDTYIADESSVWLTYAEENKSSYSTVS